jgi:hypothetical protein
MNRLSIDDILRGTEPGRMQSVGHMQVIPLLGDDDDRFAAPEVEVRTTSYGTVELRHDGDRPTIVPPGAGWVVEQAAQDHAIGGGVLLAGKTQVTITTARCIQRSQHGYIAAAKHPMLVLPAALRAQALAIRKDTGFDKLWAPIAQFNEGLGVTAAGHLEYFLRRFKVELDQFVAEFELLPRQLGAIVLVDGRIAGVERTPSSSFWRALWEPLIRVCYGSLAIQRGQGNTAPPLTRVPLASHGARTIAQLRLALAESQARERRVVAAVIQQLRDVDLHAAKQADQVLDRAQLITLASTELAGQIVREGDQVAYASLCAAELREVSLHREPAAEQELAAEQEPTTEPAAQVTATGSASSGLLERLRGWLRG